MGIVVLEGEVFELEVKDIRDAGTDLQRRKFPWKPGQLEIGLLHVIGVQVGAADEVEELAGLKAGHVREHQRQQRELRNIPRSADEDIHAHGRYSEEVATLFPCPSRLVTLGHCCMSPCRLDHITISPP